MEAMAARVRAGVGVEQPRRDDVVTEAQREPMHGTHEFGVARAPAHALRDGQRIERRLHDAGQQRGRARAGFAAFEVQKFAFAFGDAAERVERDAATVCECRRGSRRCALFVERGVDRWTAALDALLGLRVDELAHQHGKTAGRGICVQRAVRQAGGFESRTNACGERTLEFGQRERRQFFGAEFEQKVARTHAAPLWAATIGKPRASRDS
jgi:hypothetical protein